MEGNRSFVVAKLVKFDYDVVNSQRGFAIASVYEKFTEIYYLYLRVDFSRFAFTFFWLMDLTDIIWISVHHVLEKLSREYFVG